MLASKVLGDQSIENKNSIQNFFRESSTLPTFFASTCLHPKSGCHGFAASLVKDFKSHHMKLEMKGNHVSKIFFEKKTSQHSYVNMVITGCIISINNVKSIMNEISVYLDFSKLSSVYIIYPPNQIDQASKIPPVQTKIILNGRLCSLATLYSGIGFDDCIGLPNLSDQSRSYYNIPKDCFGLLYINLLLKTRKVKNDEDIVSASDYLELYFFQVKAAALTKTSSPCIIAITEKQDEQQLIYGIAQLFNISVLFKNKLPSADFSTALQLIGDKGGIIGQNGIVTLLQSLAINAQTYTFANHDCNISFYEYLSRQVPSRLKAVSSFMLGLSKNTQVAKKDSELKIVHHFFHSRIQKSMKKFKLAVSVGRMDAKLSTISTVKEQTVVADTKSSICSVLEKLTDLSWDYDESKKTARSKDVFNTLVKVEEISGESSSVLAVNLSGDEDVQKLYALTTSSRVSKKSR